MEVLIAKHLQRCHEDLLTPLAIAFTTTSYNSLANLENLRVRELKIPCGTFNSSRHNQEILDI